MLDRTTFTIRLCLSGLSDPYRINCPTHPREAGCSVKTSFSFLKPIMISYYLHSTVREAPPQESDFEVGVLHLKHISLRWQETHFQSCHSFDRTISRVISKWGIATATVLGGSISLRIHGAGIFTNQLGLFGKLL